MMKTDVVKFNCSALTRFINIFQRICNKFKIFFLYYLLKKPTLSRNEQNYLTMITTFYRQQYPSLITKQLSGESAIIKTEQYDTRPTDSSRFCINQCGYSLIIRGLLLTRKSRCSDAIIKNHLIINYSKCWTFKLHILY